MTLIVELICKAEARIRMEAVIRGQQGTEYVMALVELDEQQNAEADDTQSGAGD